MNSLLARNYESAFIKKDQTIGASLSLPCVIKEVQNSQVSLSISMYHLEITIMGSHAHYTGILSQCQTAKPVQNLWRPIYKQWWHSLCGLSHKGDVSREIIIYDYMTEEKLILDTPRRTFFNSSKHALPWAISSSVRSRVFGKYVFISRRLVCRCFSPLPCLVYCGNSLN